MELVRPIALVFWAFWRLLQSIDQIYYWGALIIFSTLYALYRLTRESTHTAPVKQPGENVVLENLDYWRNSIVFTCDEIDQDNLLKQNLGKMLAAIYAAQQPGTANIDIYTALHRQEIKLPDKIFKFLFPPETTRPSFSIPILVQAIKHTYQKIVRRLSRRDVEDYYQSIDEMLTFMESTIGDNYDKR